MTYRFKIEITAPEGAVNEQWHDDAKMFVAAATAALLHPTNAPWLKAYNCARLHEYAAQCYRHAKARTMGHNKADRYHEQAEACALAAEVYHAEAKRLWDEMLGKSA